ncbi:MAG: ATPase [Clostridia bacterium]|nr:ATPase [Clostridia bacterium]
MEILKMIDLLEDKVEQTKTIPLLNRALIDREELLAAIEEIRLNIPEDMKQAKLIKDERKRILAEAQSEAEDIINAAKIKTEKMVDEHEITKKAYEQANQIVAAAQKNSRELRMGARQYVDSLFADTDAKLTKAQSIIRKARADVRQEASKTAIAAEKSEKAE